MALIQNKKVHRDFAILEKFEAGLELLGTEVKSLRTGRGKLEGARILVRGNQAYLVGAHIPAWQEGNAPETYDPSRPRRILLSQKEIRAILGAESAQGLTTVPISVYNKGGILKAEIAIVRGKREFDKREDIKKREATRRIQRKEL